MESIEQLQENYNVANDLLKASPLYAAKELAGAALQAAHEVAKAERVAARQALHAARLTNINAVHTTEYRTTQVPPVTLPAHCGDVLVSVPDATGDVTSLVLSHESGEL